MAALLAASAVLCVPNGASAAENDALSASLAAFGDAAAARRLEDQIADLVKKRNQAGMTKLVGQIAQNDGAFMEKMDSLTQAKSRVPDPEMTRIAMALGPGPLPVFISEKWPSPLPMVRQSPSFAMG